MLLMTGNFGVMKKKLILINDQIDLYCFLMKNIEIFISFFYIYIAIITRSIKLTPCLIFHNDVNLFHW